LKIIKKVGGARFCAHAEISHAYRVGTEIVPTLHNITR